MRLKVYGIRNCDTMKKALAWLDQRKVAYDFHDYQKEGIEAAKWRKIPDGQKANSIFGAAL